MTKTLCIIFIALIATCNTIDIDYYSNNDEIEIADGQNISEKVHSVRRTDDEIQKINNSINNSIRSGVPKSDENSEEYSDYRYIDYNLPRNKKITSTTEHIRSSIPQTNTSIGSHFPLNVTLLNNLNLYSITNKTSDDLFKDYDYVYNDENLGSSLNKPQLRLDDIAEHDMELCPEKEHHIEHIKNETKKLHADFYNLEPAISKGIYNRSDKKIRNGNIWYVPEDYPCWNLPVLYGELGYRKIVSKVFLIFGGTLMNVIDPGSDEKANKQSTVDPNLESHNKWCSVAPCYGDHTLCLFSDSVNSEICDKTYEVKVPTMTERIALVNTVNSMRNRIANRDVDIYKHLLPAANMKQMVYDYNLEQFSKTWLKQCLPGPAPCSALEGSYATQLECTKYAKNCCIDSYARETASKCVPKYECFVNPLIGCIHEWFWSAKQELNQIDVKCGYTKASTFHTAQLIWADTHKIGCAYGQRKNGDVRVVCDFSPGATFYIEAKYYCGLIPHKPLLATFDDKQDITELTYLSSLGIILHPVEPIHNVAQYAKKENNKSFENLYGSEMLNRLYSEGWSRQKVYDYSNGTKSMIARLVTRYSFLEDTSAKCESDDSVYVAGDPGSMCVERGRRFNALCYEYRDPTPGYRLVAVVAPLALFLLILYDLFSGAVKQTQY